jgi:hypothetical protein
MQYKTGTVAVTNGNAGIVGTGTAWLASVTVGSVFSVAGSGVPYIVANVVDDTHITLASNYGAPTLGGLSYAITTSFTPNQKLPYPEATDIDTHTIVKRAMLQIDTMLGAAIGGAGQANRVVFTDANGNLATSSNLAYSTATGNLVVTASSGNSISADRTGGAGSVRLLYGGTETAQFSAISGGGLQIYTGSSPAEQMRVTNVTSAVNYLWVRGSTTNSTLFLGPEGSDANVTFFVQSKGAAELQLATNSTVAMRVTTAQGILFPGISTTANAANAFLDSGNSNNLLRSTSSLRYKQDLRDFTLEDARKVVFGRYGFDYASMSPHDDVTKRWIGFAAEDVAEDDDRFVTRDISGAPDWVQYERFVVPHSLILGDHESRLKRIEARAQ